MNKNQKTLIMAITISCIVILTVVAMSSTMPSDTKLRDKPPQEILNLGEKQYEPFSKEQFPKTGGFNPAWLEGEKELILESCVESKSDGYELDYCQYLQ